MLLVVAPLTLSLGAFAGNDLFVGLAICVAVERLIATSGARPLLVGLLAGAAWGAKYTALPAAAGIGFAAALVARGGVARRWSGTAIVGVVTILLPSVWTLRSLLLTGNPLYPAFRSVFGGRYWDTVSATLVAEQVSHGGLVNRGISAFVLALVDLVTRAGDLGFPGGLNPLFVPLGLVGLIGLRRIRGGNGLLVVLLFSYVGWSATSLNVRYALGMLAALTPFVAFTLQRAVVFSARESWRRLAGPALGVLLLLAIAGPLTDGVVRHMRYYGQETKFLGGTPRRDMLTSRLDIAAAGRAAAARLPADARILLVAEGRFAPLPRPTVASSAYDRPDIARIVRGAQSIDELNDRLRDFTHVVVNYRELERFVEQYRFAERFEPADWQLFRDWLARGLEPDGLYGNVAIYRLPGGQAGG